MQFSVATIVFAAAYLSQLGAAIAIPESVPDMSHTLDKRDSYGHCACQYGPNSEIDPVATNQVAHYNLYRWHKEKFDRKQFQDGAHFPGRYMVGNNGDKINGKSFYRECIYNGGGDSTCF